ncbi:DNA polymerase III subunit delta [Paenibacillus hexagrammi]|uniref:DNA polymerase III subunit delta n=1 Tax=Paenibacillus hexagrammi TaxID=2908839 RepID=A0ABY3SLV8_9BACL|nr:DNA polymerase III subunit delta [Paenibacillus sp. YPD9-1]UJF35039.1 DNA polymerase III subunit delta [Paenibacillus sp. YPD9-1]
MDVKKAWKDIQAGRTAPVYLCYGPEKYRMREFIQHVSDHLIEPEHREFAVSKFDLGETSLSAVLEDAETLPFMVPKKFIIATNAIFFTGARDTSKVEHDLERLIDYLKSPAEHSVIIFTVDAEKLDERKKVVKSLKEKEAVIPFLSLSSEELQSWVVKQAQKLDFTFASGAADQLILYTGGNLQVLSAELEKISLYIGSGGVATEAVIDQLVARSTEQNVFILIEDIVNLRLDRAFVILEELLKQREEPIKIAALIARQFRIMLQVKELGKQGYSQQQMASQIGLHPYAVKIAEGQAKKYEANKLSVILARLADLDYQMKSGRIDKVLGLEMFLLQLAA